MAARNCASKATQPTLCGHLGILLKVNTWVKLNNVQKLGGLSRLNATQSQAQEGHPSCPIQGTSLLREVFLEKHAQSKNAYAISYFLQSKNGWRIGELALKFIPEYMICTWKMGDIWSRRVAGIGGEFHKSKRLICIKWLLCRGRQRTTEIL